MGDMSQVVTYTAQTVSTPVTGPANEVSQSRKDVSQSCIDREAVSTPVTGPAKKVSPGYLRLLSR